MPTTIPSHKLEQIIQQLPTKDRIALREQTITTQWLQEKIAQTRRQMKMDVWIGLPLMLIYLGLMVWSYSTGQNILNNFTLAAGVLAFGYFGYTIFTAGSFGTNKKRLHVYEQLLHEIK